MITLVHSQPIVKAPARDGQRLADKLQRLVLEQPRVAMNIERLVDLFLDPKGGA